MLFANGQNYSTNLEGYYGEDEQNFRRRYLLFYTR